EHEQDSGRQRNPEDSAPRLVLEGENGGGVGGRGHVGNAIAEVNADQGSRNDSESQQPLKDSSSLAASERRQTFRKVERDNHADEPAAYTLQQPSEKQRPIAVRKSDHRNADHKCEAAENHQGFTAHPVGEQSRKQGRD